RQGLLNPPKVTGKFRVDLVKWKQQNHASITATCGHFGFASVEAIVRWERLYNLYGSQVLLEMRTGVKPHRKRIRSGTHQTPRAREFIIADTLRRLKKITSLEKASNQELSQVII
ncbi:helix-turn-helix domain-containing protein, partial [Furfurilactobacillus entadae]|uniref:helix-turn-helix domain-containing protein n=1 Tax=Furfurilactobacillus entadae TaxID=2922307 RepID=UPI0038B27B56